MAAPARLTDNLEDLVNAACERTATRVLLAAAGSFIPPRKFLTNVQTAQRLDIEPDTLSLWRSRGEGPAHVGSGKLVRYSVDAIDAWLAALPRAEK